ncbi:heterokaryon incompatibility protein-domain-containing protein [Cubamyces menziesii]|nr:heterokaryon incompatibility protein-domain-containing protein [Cubamyces menziesii]
MRPDDVCVHCWNGVFEKHFGFRYWAMMNSTVMGTWFGGFTYSVSYDELVTCKDSNCVWYRLLKHDAFDDMLEWFQSRADDRLQVTVGLLDSLEEAKRFIVVLDSVLAIGVSLRSDIPEAAWIREWAGTLRVKTLDALAWARASADECAREHNACQDFLDWARPGASLPTRLIDCSDPFRPRIVETKDSDPHERYLALSYVWGGEQPNRTTVENLSAYMVGIDIRSLPKTIVDAIRVTHALGFQYLWVDSLCILQDSREDKHRELGRMRDVYRHAFLTIDAASAKSASEGFLDDLGRIAMNASDWLPFAWFRRHKGSPRQLVDMLNMDTIGPEAPERIEHNDSFLVSVIVLFTISCTARRAWCLQETLMSGRLLCFPVDSVYLQCRMLHHRSTTGFRVFDDILLSTTTPDAIFHPNPSVSPGSGDWLTIHSAWVGVVEDYSRRLLSDPKDALVACAGLAEAFGHVLGPHTQYLAGLWRDNLLFYLCWYTLVDYTFVYRADTRAPSWSWAAQSLPVTFQTYLSHGMPTAVTSWLDWEELAEIVECAVTLEDPELPFGSVTGGHIILRAPLLGPYNTQDLRSTRERCKLSLDDVELPAEDKRVNATTSLWIIPLLYPPTHARENWPMHCLLVLPCATRSISPPTRTVTESCYGVYQRVGYCAFGGGQKTGQIIAPLLDSLENKVDGQWDFPRVMIKLV